jgi:hypothetical protein
VTSVNKTGGLRRIPAGLTARLLRRRGGELQGMHPNLARVLLGKSHTRRYEVRVSSYKPKQRLDLHIIVSLYRQLH